MAKLVRRDSDMVLVGMILIIAAAIGQFLFDSLRGNRYANFFPAPGMFLFFGGLSLVAGLILITVGMLRLLRKVESRLTV